MCIIVAKYKNVDLPSKEILKNCFERNNDGAGFSYFGNDNLVHIKKGFMSFNEFYNKLMEVDKTDHLKDKNVIIHFRISTSGLVDVGNCHPYPLTKKVDYLRATNLKCKMAIAHNGIISKYNKKDNILNDSQLFIQNVLCEFYKLDNDFTNNEFIMSIIKDLIGTSKLAFINEKGEMKLLGDFVKDNGVYYSNSTYKSYNYYPYYKYNYNNYSYFDDDYWKDYEFYTPTKKKTTKTKEKKQLSFFKNKKNDIMAFNNIHLSNYLVDDLKKNSLLELKTNYKVEKIDNKIFNIDKNNKYYVDNSLNIFEFLKDKNIFQYRGKCIDILENNKSILKESGVY